MTAAVGYWSGSLTYGTKSIPFGNVDANGTMWLLHGVDGWDGAAIGSGQVTQNSGDHGGVPSPQFYGPRLITLRVTAMAPTQALRDVARSDMARACPIGSGGANDLATFVYNEPIPKTTKLRRDDRIQELSLDLNSVSFSVPLIAPDPRKYSVQTYTTPISPPTPPTGLAPPFTPPLLIPAAAPSNEGTFTNHGDFETPWYATVYGPWTSPSFHSVEQNRTVTYTGLTLGAGDILQVDSLNFMGFLNGSVFYSADAGSDWFRLQPDTNRIRIGGSGSGSATITYSDAWQ
jgi:hypothetical protein